MEIQFYFEKRSTDQDLSVYNPNIPNTLDENYKLLVSSLLSS
jgi:hypothetical protein